MQTGNMKQELLEQLNMSDMDGKGIKIYQTGGMKFSVSDKDLHQDLPGARHLNKQKLGQAVHDRVNELEQEFQDRDDKIQRIVESEQ